MLATLISGLAYLGGRFVLGSGRTWPHDFRFLVGFLSGLVVDPGVMGSAEEFAGVEIDVSDAASPDAVAPGVEGTTSCFESDKAGVIASMGSIVFGAEVEVENNGGYISPGAESSDSAGEVSNLTAGEAWSSHSAMLTANLCILVGC